MKEIIQEYGGALLACICGICVTGLVAGYFMDDAGILSRTLSELMKNAIG